MSKDELGGGDAGQMERDVFSIFNDTNVLIETWEKEVSAKMDVLSGKYAHLKGLHIVRMVDARRIESQAAELAALRAENERLVSLIVERDEETDALVERYKECAAVLRDVVSAAYDGQWIDPRMTDAFWNHAQQALAAIDAATKEGT